MLPLQLLFFLMDYVDACLVQEHHVDSCLVQEDHVDARLVQEHHVDTCLVQKENVDARLVQEDHVSAHLVQEDHSSPDPLEPQLHLHHARHVACLRRDGAGQCVLLRLEKHECLDFSDLRWVDNRKEEIRENL